MQFRYATILALLLGGTLGAQAQGTVGFGFEYRPAAKVVQGTDTLRQAWTGGFASPQFSSIDLDGDSNQDLFVFDRQSRRVYTFLSVASGTGRAWQYAPDYESLFPAGLAGWALLRDYDCDGRPDLLTQEGGSGIRLYRNVPQNGRPSFQNIGLLQERLSGGGVSPVNTGGDNIPDFRDVNGDGKLDMVSYEFFASAYMELYINDTPGACSSSLPIFQSPVRPWGNIYSCGSCDGYSVSGQTTCFTATKTQHSQGHNVLLVDLNGDGVPDVLDGRDNCPNLVRLLNQGSGTTASFPPASITSSQFPTTAHPARTSTFPAGYLIDADFDGREDVVVSPSIINNLSDNVTLRNTVNLYRNTTAAGATGKSFDYVAGGFLQGSMIDVSEGAAPAFGDLDGDGLKDMLVANHADRVNGRYRATLSHYRNVGTATRPIFRLETSDYLGLSAGNFTEMRPVLVDLNRDGKLDLAYDAYRISANRLFFLLNTAPAGQAAAFNVAALDSLQLIANPSGAIPFNNYDAPCFTDVDNDGFVDLLIGTNSTQGPGMSLQYFRNQGSGPLNQAFVIADNDFGRLRNAQGQRPNNLSPAVADFDGDGRPDLLTWDSSGNLSFYSDYRSQTGAFLGRTSLFYNSLSSNYEGARLGLGRDIHNTLAAADLNGDNVPELLVGLQAGGVVSFGVTNRLGGVSGLAARSSAAAALALLVYPNPATGTATVETATPTRLALLDLLGRTVQQPAARGTRHQLNLDGLAPGIYLVRATDASGTSAVRRLQVR